MRQIETRKGVRVGDLRDSEFREFLGPILDEDVLALKEDSFDRYNDFWMGIRAYEKDGNLHLLFGHRRIRAMILKEGPNKPVQVKVVEVSDEEKILFLGEAGWKNATEDERLGLVKLAAAFLVEYGEGNSTQVDIDLLKECMHLHWQNVGSTRISNWLGKRLWPQDRIWKLIEKGKQAVREQEFEKENNQAKQAEIQTAIEPVHSDENPGFLALPDYPNEPTNMTAVSSGGSNLNIEGASVATASYMTEAQLPAWATDERYAAYVQEDLRAGIPIFDSSLTRYQSKFEQDEPKRLFAQQQKEKEEGERLKRDIRRLASSFDAIPEKLYGMETIFAGLPQDSQIILRNAVARLQEYFSRKQFNLQ